jgi:diacylglycerol kinase (ATP)
MSNQTSCKCDSENTSVLQSSPFKGATGIKRLMLATKYSMKGLGAAWLHEAAFRQEIVAAIILIPLALVAGNNGVERALLIASVLLVVIVELVNSAIEALVDRVGFDYHELSGRAKDMGSAAVFISLILAMLMWGLILL